MCPDSTILYGNENPLRPLNNTYNAAGYGMIFMGGWAKCMGAIGVEAEMKAKWTCHLTRFLPSFLRHHVQQPSSPRANV